MGKKWKVLIIVIVEEIVIVKEIVIVEEIINYGKAIYLYKNFQYLYDKL
jgi:hypothetical protein